MLPTTLETLVIKLTANSVQYEKVMNSVERKAMATARKLTRIGRQMAVAITLPLMAVGGIGVQQFATFDDAMIRSTSIMEVTTEQMDRMRKTAQNLVATGRGPQSADMLAESYFFLASAGLKAEAAMKALPVVQDFATAGAFDMALATDLLTDAQSSLGLSVKDATQNMVNMTRVSDVLIKANTLANATAEQFSKALVTKSGAALRLVNKDIEEGVAILAAYADQGIKAEAGGEKLAIMMRDLQTASIKNADAWEKMKLKVFDTDGQLRPMVDIIDDLTVKLAGASDQQKKLTLMTLGFTDRSVNAITSLVGMTDKIREYERELRKAGGTTQDIAQKQMKSFLNQLKVTRNLMGLVAAEVGERLAPAILNMNNKIRDGLKWFRGLNDETKDWVVQIGKIAALAGPAALGLGGLIAVGGQMAFGIRQMWPAIMMAVNAFKVLGVVALLPFLKVIAIVAAVSAAIVGLAYLIVGKEGLAKAWDYVSTAAVSFFKKVRGFFANFRENWSTLTSWFKENWKSVLLDMGRMVLLYYKNMAINVAMGLKVAARLFAAFSGWLYGWAVRTWNYVFSAEFVTMIVQGVGKAMVMFRTFTMSLAKMFTSFVGKMAILWDGFVEAFKQAAMDMGMIMAEVWAAILRGEIPDPVAIFKKFSAKAAVHMAKIGAEVGVMFMDEINAISDAMEAAGERLTQDFIDGATNTNFFDTARKILGDEAKNFVNPFEGFGFAAGLPKFNFTLPGELAEQFKIFGDAAEWAGKKAGGLVGEARKWIGGFMGTKNAAEDAKKAIDQVRAVDTFDAAAAGSAEALRRVQAHRLRFGAGQLGLKGKPAAVKVEQKGAPENKKEEEKDRKNMVGFLGSIARAVTKDTVVMQAANFLRGGTS